VPNFNPAPQQRIETRPFRDGFTAAFLLFAAANKILFGAPFGLAV